MSQQRQEQDKGGDNLRTFVLGNKELEGKVAEFQYDKGWYTIVDIVGEEKSVVYKSKNAQEAYTKWNVYIGRKKERPSKTQNPEGEEEKKQGKEERTKESSKSQNKEKEKPRRQQPQEEPRQKTNREVLEAAMAEQRESGEPKRRRRHRNRNRNHHGGSQGAGNSES